MFNIYSHNIYIYRYTNQLFIYSEKMKPVPVFTEHQIAYIPVMKKIKEETGHEEKYGGSVPFFKEGEKWPVCARTGKHMFFVAQFFDPRWHPNAITLLDRVFINDPYDSSLYGKGSKDALVECIFTDKKQIIIPMPDDVKPLCPAQEIMSWFQHLDYNLDELNNSYDFNDYLFYESSMCYSGFKVEGFGNTCQSVVYKHYIQNVLSGKWGDSGSLHISENGEVYGDMC